jgi:hypothetical protein
LVVFGGAFLPRLCRRFGAAGLFPPVVAAALQEALNQGLPRLPWIQAPAEPSFRTGIESLLKQLMAGS